MTADAEQNARDVLRLLCDEFPDSADVRLGRMFNGLGAQTGTSFFAFVSNTGRLVVKLAADDAARRVRDGSVEPVRMGRRTMREWVSLPPSEDGDPSRWRLALRDAHTFVHALNEPDENRC